MNFATAISDALTKVRELAESLMADTCNVTRADSDTAPDPLTGQSTRITVYTGKCKGQVSSSMNLTPEVSGQTLSIQRSELHFPVGAFDMQIDDLAEITASSNPDRVGRKFRITQVAPMKTFETAYRVGVEEV